MNRRSWWIEIQPVHSMFNFKWSPFSGGIKFGTLGHTNYGEKREEVGHPNHSSHHSQVNSTNNASSNYQDKLSQQVVNHFEQHQLITEKYNLLAVMQKFCDIHKENTFNMMPITFFVEISDATRDQAIHHALTPFTQFYQLLETNKNGMDKLKS